MFVVWFLIWMEEFWINWFLWPSVFHGYGCGSCLSSSAGLLALIFSLHLKEIIYYTFLFCILLIIHSFLLVLHLDHSSWSSFPLPCWIFRFQCTKVPLLGFVLARLHDCQFSCFIAYQGTVKLTFQDNSQVFILGLVSLFSKHWLPPSAALMFVTLSSFVLAK